MIIIKNNDKNNDAKYVDDNYKNNDQIIIMTLISK
jgi:hypothetical protein